MCALGSAHCASNKARFRGNKHQINSDKTSGSSTWVCKLTCSVFHLSPQHKGSNNKYFTVLIHFHKYSEASTHCICIFTPLCMQPLVLPRAEYLYATVCTECRLHTMSNNTTIRMQNVWNTYMKSERANET